MNEELLSKVFLSVGEMNAKADRLLDGQAKLEATIEAHGGRIHSLENSRLRLMAGVGAIVATLQLCGKWVWTHMGGGA